jgi:hypothetical protein
MSQRPSSEVSGRFFFVGRVAVFGMFSITAVATAASILLVVDLRRDVYHPALGSRTALCGRIGL